MHEKILHFFRNRCFMLMLSVLLLKTSYGQYNSGAFEAGIIIAPSNFLGDLGGNAGKGAPFLKDNNISMTRLIAGAHISYHPADWYGVRLALNYGNIAGDDAVIKGKGGLEEARKIRNLNFKSAIAEAYLVGELYPTVFLEADPSERLHKFRPYVVAGVGIFHFNPQGKDAQTGDWVKLRALHTEGQGFPELAGRKNYSLTQLNVPLGIGIKYFLTEQVSIGFDILTRKTFTDYIDDVSTSYIDNNLFYKNLPLSAAIVATRMYDKSAGSANRNAGEKRGTAGHNDAYYAAGVKLSIRFGDINPFLSSSRCPVFKN